MGERGYEEIVDFWRFWEDLVVLCWRVEGFLLDLVIQSRRVKGEW